MVKLLLIIKIASGVISCAKEESGTTPDSTVSSSFLYEILAANPVQLNPAEVQSLRRRPGIIEEMTRNQDDPLEESFLTVLHYISTGEFWKDLKHLRIRAFDKINEINVSLQHQRHSYPYRLPNLQSNQ